MNPLQGKTLIFWLTLHESLSGREAHIMESMMPPGACVPYDDEQSALFQTSTSTARSSLGWEPPGEDEEIKYYAWYLLIIDTVDSKVILKEGWEYLPSKMIKLDTWKLGNFN